MIRRMRSACLAVAVGLASPALAQDGAADAAPTVCELHVWPAAAMRFANQGEGHNFKSGLSGGLLAGFEPPERRGGLWKRVDPDAPAEKPFDLLSLSEQGVLLSASPDGTIFGLPGHRLVIHDTALTSREIRGTPGRYAAGSSPCYADLVLDSLILSNEWSNGQNLKSLYRFRDFGTGNTPTRSFGAWVQTKLVIEPEDIPAKFDEAKAEMRAAFTNNVALFGAALTTNATTGTTKQGKKK